MSTNETSPPADPAGEERSEDAQLFDRLYRALTHAFADLYPLDTTHVTGNVDSNRSTLMARTDQSGRRYISERFMFKARLDQWAGALILDRLATSIFLDENDAIVVAQRENDQRYDEAGRPVPGVSNGTSEFSILEEPDRSGELARIAQSIQEIVGEAPPS